MSKIETKRTGLHRDIHSKALTPSSRNPEYQRFLEQKAMSKRMDDLESKMDTILDLLRKDI